MSRDHSVIFEIASKYCISDSFIDYEGYSISSKGFLPAVVDIMVIWVKFPHSSPSSSLIPKMLTFTLAICQKPHIQGKRNPSKTVGTERGHQRADRLKPQSQTTGQSDHTDHSLSNWMKLSHAVCGHPRRMGHGGEVWQNVVPWRREWQTTSVFLPREPHEQYEKAKR